MSNNLSNSVILLISRAIANVEFQTRKLTEAPREDFVKIARNAQALADAAKDVRTLVTAIAHGICSPRPDLGALAGAQAVTHSALRRRYPEKILAPLTSLNDGNPVDAKCLVDCLESLGPADLLSIDAELDRSIESDFGAVSPSSLVKEIMPRRTIAEMPRLSDLLKHPSWEISSAAEPVRSPERDQAYKLLGEIFKSLSDVVEPTVFQAWTAGSHRATNASIAWEGGPSMDQLLVLLLPLEEDGSLVRGILGLRVTRFDATTCYLIRDDGRFSVDLRLNRG